jgi:NitT/TauT family transport system permease protein
MNIILRIASLLLLLILWQIGSAFFGPRLLPTPLAVLATMADEARSGALLLNVGATLARVTASFILAMSFGVVIGVAMGRRPAFDRIADSWVVILLNMPALVIIVLAYVWVGLNEVAAIGAVALNKLPNAIVTIREGARALDHELDEVAQVFRMPKWVRVRHVLLPQLGPYIAAAARSGLSLVWKIVLVVELIGRSNGVGFEIGVAFHLFDIRLLLAYAIPFLMVMLVIENVLVQPFERHVARWRFRAA